MSFQTEKPAPRQHCVTLRLTDDQNELLTGIAARLETSKGELLRKTLDYWLENSPEGKRALRAK